MENHRVALTLRVPKPIADALTRVSREQERSRTKQIVMYLRRGLTNDGIELATVEPHPDR